MDSDSTDLKAALRAALESKGVLKDIKAKLRAEVFHCLEDKTVELPDKPRDVHIANEIIREYMTNFNLTNSLSVFMEEGGQPAELSADRQFLASELGLRLRPDEKEPLLVVILRVLRELHNARIDELNSDV